MADEFIKTKIDFQKFEKALFQLTSALKSAPLNDLERDGIIQRFEYSIELLWKISKKVLEENGVIAIAPKDVIREMAHIGWIENPNELIEFLKMRNESSHAYDHKFHFDRRHKDLYLRQSQLYREYLNH